MQWHQVPAVTAYLNLTSTSAYNSKQNEFSGQRETREKHKAAICWSQDETPQPKQNILEMIPVYSGLK